MSPINRPLPVFPDAALLATRVWMGIVGVYHGSQKLFGWFDGPGIEGFAGFLTSLKVPMPTLNAYLAGGAEFFGGLVIALGLVTRPAAFFFMFTMLVGAFTAHAGKFGAQKGGGEYALTLAVIALGLILTGPGRLTVARLWGKGTQVAR